MQYENHFSADIADSDKLKTMRRDIIKCLTVAE